MERRYENEGNCVTAEAVWPKFLTDPLPKYFLKQPRDNIESLIKENVGSDSDDWGEGAGTSKSTPVLNLCWLIKFILDNHQTPGRG